MAELEEASDRERRRRGDQTCQPGKNLQWWACSNTKSSFVGCCSVDPCDGTECPDPPEWQQPGLDKKNPTPAIEKTTDDSDVTTVMSVGPPVAVTFSTSDDDDDITTTSARRTVHTTITVEPTTESENPWFPSPSKHTSTSDEPATDSSSPTTQFDPSSTADVLPTTDNADATPLPSSSGAAGADLPPSDSGNTGFSSLPTSTRMGVYVGVPAAVALAALLLFIFIRRRRRSQGTSMRDASSPNYDDDKFLPKTMGDPTSPGQPVDGSNEPRDVFAPFGGRVNSVRTIPNPLFAHPPTMRAELGDSSVPSRHTGSVNTASKAVSSAAPISTGGVESDAMAELASEPGSPKLPPETSSSLAKEVTMVRPSSQPRYVDIDSASGSGNSIQAEAPQSEWSATSPSQQPPSQPPSHPSQADKLSTMPSQQLATMGSRPASMSVTHPPQLTPGFGGTQMRIQRPVEDADDTRQQGGTHQGQQGEQEREEPELRANLNPTADEQQKNAHVTAWQKL